MSRRNDLSPRECLIGFLASLAFIFAMSVLMSGCATAGSGRSGAAVGTQGTRYAVAVDNSNFEDVAVYVVRGPASYTKLGVVTGNTRALLWLRSAAVGADGAVRLGVRTFPGGATWVSDPITVRADQRIQLDIAPMLRTSSAWASR